MFDARQKKDEIEKETSELRKVRESIERMMRDDKGIESSINAIMESVSMIESSLKEFGSGYDSETINRMLAEQSKKIEELS